MPESRQQALSFEGFVIDLARGCLRRDSADVKLRPKSFAVLRFLAENRGRLLSKEEIINAVWNDAFVTDNSLVQCLIEIRRALGDDSQTIIRTVTRRGYIFDVAVAAGDEYERSVGLSRRQKSTEGQILRVLDTDLASTVPSTPQAHANSAAEAVAATRVELLGGFRISCKGAQVTAVNTSRMQSLLAYLLLHGGSAVSRQHLAFLFWPESSETQARTNLRQLIHHLKSNWEESESYIESCAQLLRWRTEEPFTFDVAEFESAIAHAEEREKQEDHAAARSLLRQCIELYRGDLLPGVDEEWIESHRERLKQRRADALRRLIRLCELARDYPAAIHYAEGLLAHDNLSEAGYQMLMRLHGLNGDRAQALQVYERCVAVLSRELGVQPGIATRKLRERTASAEPYSAFTSEVSAPKEPTLVGREREWKELVEMWRRVNQGAARFVLITGEAGIGKTRLMDELKDFVSRQGAPTARTACYAAERPMAYSALAEWFRTPVFRAKVDGLASAQRSQLARVLPELLATEPQEAPGVFTETWQRHQFFEALARAVLSAPRPIMLCIDDLQWCDPETIEWLHYLLRSNAQECLLVVATARIEELENTHPAASMLHALVRSDQASQLILEPFSAEETASLATLLLKRAVEQEITAALYENTRGNPLFIVEAVRSKFLAQPANTAAVRNVLPPKVEAVIVSRLGQLTQPAREIAAVAAALAHPFTLEFMVEVSRARGDEEEIVSAIDELWRRRIIHTSGEGFYEFCHGHIRAVAYSEIGPARRHYLHIRIAETLEASHAHSSAIGAQIAWHYEQAGAVEKAIACYHDAAKAVRSRYSEAEAIGYLQKARDLLETMAPGQERDRTELFLLLSLGPALIATEGYGSPKVGRVYARARLLCELTGETGVLYLRVLAGSHAHHVVRAELATAQETASRYWTAACMQGDPNLLAAGHFALGSTFSNLGLLAEAREHFQAALVREDASAMASPIWDFGPELTVFTRAHLAHALWLLGYADEAVAEIQSSVAFAERLAQPFSLALALAYSAILHHFRGESRLVERDAVAAAEICEKYGFPYYLSWVPILKGWACAQRGAATEGLAQMREGFAAFQATGAALRGAYYLALLAETCRAAGNPDESWKYIREAFVLGDRTRESWIRPELWRIKGRILLDRGDRREAEACYREALRAARDLETRFFELRAATGLVRLAHSRASKNAAMKILEESYRKFGQGFDTPDLAEARELLDSSGGRNPL